MGGLLTISYFQQPRTQGELKYYMSEDVTPRLSALSWLVFDVDTGEELYSKDAGRELPIASITKLATASAFVTYNYLGSTTAITWSDLSADGLQGRLSFGETYTYQELLFPLLLESSNDASETLLRVDPNLLTEMQTLTNDLLLTQTKFVDTSGLSSDNVSTAHEVAILLRSISISQPHIIDITSLPSYINYKNGWINNNPVSGEDGYAGGKHGFTYEANRTFAGFFIEEFYGGHVRKIGYVLLGSENILKDIRLLRTFVVDNTRIR